MKLTKEMPIEGTKRSRKVFAFTPQWFEHGSNDKPLRTMIWFEHYIVDENYQYGEWNYRGKRLNDT